MAQQIQLRNGTATAWTTANPILAAGEMGIETDTFKAKVGNGVTAWNSLAYLTGGGGGSGTVTSVSIVSANGFAGSVATATTVPAITVSTSITGMVKANGTSLQAATSGTDYSAGTSGLATGILKSTTGTGALTVAIAGDFPTFNQNTTGTASNVTGTVAAANGGTAQTTYTLGDILYSSATNTLAKLAGQTTTTRNFLRQTGNGTISAAPAWDTVTKSDVGLSAVENTALSTWAGSANITTLGTIGTGVWSATTIAVNKGGTGITVGTSGGILGFTATGTLASSALLAANGIVLGGGAGATPLTASGIATDGTSKITLGTAGSTVGAVIFNNATSGSVTLQPVTGALGSVTLSLPSSTGTLATLQANVDAVATTTYTILTSDLGRHKVFTNAAGCSVTVPSGLGATFNCSFAKASGAGTVTFVASSTTLINEANSLVMTASAGIGGLVPTNTTDTYTLAGSFGTANVAYTNVTQIFTKNISGAPVTLTDGATIATDSSLANNFKVTLGGNRTLSNPTNLTDGMTLLWRIKQDATGSRTLAYGTLFDWGAAGTPVLSTGANLVDIISGYYDGTDNKIYSTISKGF
jgi:hypothetical protein